MTALDFDSLRAVLLDAILKKQPVQTMFDRVYGCIGLPLIAFDVSFQVIAYTFPRPFYYPHWENMVSKGYASEEAIVANSYLIYQEMMYAKGRSQIFDWGTCKGYAQAAGPVLQEGRLVGYVGIMLEGTDAKQTLQANDLLAGAIALLLRGGHDAALDKMSREHLAEHVLLGNGISGEFAAQLTAKFRPPYVFALLSTREAGVSTLQYVRSVMCVPSNSILGCLSGEKYLYMLYYGVEPAKDLPAIRASLQSIAEKYSFLGGVSGYFSDPLSIPSRRMQALLAMYVGGKNGSRARVSAFQECYNEIVAYCALEQFGASACLLPDIEKLADRDRKSGGNYLTALEVYLDQFRRYSAAAARLGQHRNTIFNKIRKIGEFLGIDLSDCGCADRLLAGIEMHRMAGRGDLFSRKEMP